MMGRSFCLALAALLVPFALGLPVRAQDASTLKKDMVGQWELRPPNAARPASSR